MTLVTFKQGELTHLCEHRTIGLTPDGLVGYGAKTRCGIYIPERRVDDQQPSCERCRRLLVEAALTELNTVEELVVVRDNGLDVITIRRVPR